MVVARADQVVTGIGLNLVVLGLTGYLFGIVGADGFTTGAIAEVRVPGLADIPWAGQLFDQPWLAYVGYALVPVAAVGDLPHRSRDPHAGVRRVRRGRPRQRRRRRPARGSWRWR